MKQFLAEAGIGPQEYFLRDGSGLSRMNLVTPAAIVTLLAYMWQSPHRADWLDTLPVAGFDGTLRSRLVGTPAAEQLRGKTGSLSHVAALSGYLLPTDGRHLAFAVLVNNFNAESGPFRTLIDRLCAEILQGGS